MVRQQSQTTFSDSIDSSSDEYSMDIDDQRLEFNEKLLVTDIGDLAEICKSKCGLKNLSTLVYMSLRYFNLKWEDADDFLKNICLMTAQTCHKPATLFLKGDYQEFSGETNRTEIISTLLAISPSLCSRSNICRCVETILYPTLQNCSSVAPQNNKYKHRQKLKNIILCSNVSLKKPSLSSKNMHETFLYEKD